MKKYLAQVLALVVTLAALFGGASAAYAQGARATKIVMYRNTVGTTTAAAIASPASDLIGWKICNDAENTSTHLLVGMASDVSTDGTMLAKGACYECTNCPQGALALMKVEGQAASNGYSVIQYKR